MLSKPILVEMTRFELATSTSRTWRSTKLSHISLMIFSLFSVSGQTCGQTTYIGVVIELIIAQKCSVFKGFRRFCKFYARNRQFAPEPSALPNCATPRKLIIRCAHYLLQLGLRLRDLLACLHQVAATRLFSLHPPPAALETLPNCATPRKWFIQHRLVYHKFGKLSSDLEKIILTDFVWQKNCALVSLLHNLS